MDWRASSEDMLGFTDSVAIGSLQPIELDPLVNIAVGAPTEKGQSTNIWGYIWGSDIRGSLSSGGASSQMPPPASVEDKAPWVYGSWGSANTIDGDVDQPTHSWVVSGYTFDLGLAVPLNRVVFFPPERGRGAAGPYLGLLFRDLYPRQYVISGSLSPQEFLSSNPSGDFDQVFFLREVVQIDMLGLHYLPVEIGVLDLIPPEVIEVLRGGMIPGEAKHHHEDRNKAICDVHTGSPYDREQDFILLRYLLRYPIKRYKCEKSSM